MNVIARTVTLLVVLLFVVHGCDDASQPPVEEPEEVPAAPETSTSPRPRLAEPTRDQRIVLGDIVEVSIFELHRPSTDHSDIRRVDSTGTIRLSLIGDVQVDGLTTDEVRASIVNTIIENGMIRSPNVRVAIRPQVDPQRPHTDHRLEPNDMIAVNIFELTQAGEDYTEFLRVGGDGSIELPQVGHTDVAGLTTRELEDKLSNLLVSKLLFHRSILNHTHVRVNMGRDQARKRF